MTDHCSDRIITFNLKFLQVLSTVCSQKRDPKLIMERLKSIKELKLKNSDFVYSYLFLNSKTIFIFIIKFMNQL